MNDIGIIYLIIYIVKKADLTCPGTERHLNIHDFDNRDINLKLTTLHDWTTTDIDFLHDSPEQLHFSNIGIEYNEGDNIIQNIGDSRSPYHNYMSCDSNTELVWKNPDCQNYMNQTEEDRIANGLSPIMGTNDETLGDLTAINICEPYCSNTGVKLPFKCTDQCEFHGEWENDQHGLPNGYKLKESSTQSPEELFDAFKNYINNNEDSSLRSSLAFGQDTETLFDFNLSQYIECDTEAGYYKSDRDIVAYCDVNLNHNIISNSITSLEINDSNLDISVTIDGDIDNFIQSINLEPNNIVRIENLDENDPS